MQGGIEFQEDETLYQFVFDVRPCTPLYKALGVSLEEDSYGQKLLADAVERLGLSPGQQHYIHKLWSGKPLSCIQGNLLLYFPAHFVVVIPGLACFS